jgi:hypothetical protein
MSTADPLEGLLAPSLLEGLHDRSLDVVRTQRNACQGAENGLSYVRRLAQGRLDIVGREVEHRREGGAPSDVSSLLEELPEILADRMRGPGLGRPPQDLEPTDVPEALLQRLDGIAGPTVLGELSTLDDERLGGLVASLQEFEQEVSGLRRRLHDQIDALQGEITRRYRDGEASVETLLA